MLVELKETFHGTFVQKVRGTAQLLCAGVSTVGVDEGSEDYLGEMAERGYRLKLVKYYALSKVNHRKFSCRHPTGN